MNNLATEHTNLSVPFLQLTDEQWTRLVDVNLRGAWLCSQDLTGRSIHVDGGWEGK